MLLSHSHKFIYLKTIKTASTSVEIFFQKYCVPSGLQETHVTEQVLTPYGIVGYRGPNRGDSTFWNHMPAKSVCDLLHYCWKNYFKFCVVRNPYDKVVSKFWMTLNDENKNEFERASFIKVRNKFHEFCLDVNNLPIDKDVYSINGHIVCDYVIKYENLLDGIMNVCNELDIEPNLHLLGSYKSHHRRRREHYSEYYNESTSNIIRKFYDFEFCKLNYKELRFKKNY